jgi:hypothetical protein
MADLIAISQSDAGDLLVESKSISGNYLSICVETGKCGAIASETIKMRKQRPAPSSDQGRTVPI